MCAETKLYTESICEAVEAEWFRLCRREQIIIEGQTFHPKTLPVALEEDSAIADRWPILRAWRWLVKDSEKETRYSDFYKKNNMQAIETEDAFDMAYGAIITLPLGWAIMKIIEKDDRYSDDEEYATTLESYEAASEFGKRKNK